MKFSDVPQHIRMLSWVQLCDPMDCSLPGSSVHGILQVKVRECIAISFPGGFSQTKDEPVSSESHNWI